MRLLGREDVPTYKAVAHELGIAEGTVRVLAHRAYRKLGVSNRYDAAERLRLRDARRSRSQM